MRCLLCPKVRNGIGGGSGRSNVKIVPLQFENTESATKSLRCLRFIGKVLDLDLGELALVEGLNSSGQILLFHKCTLGGSGISLTFCEGCATLFQSVLKIHKNLSPILDRIGLNVLAKKSLVSISIPTAPRGMTTTTPETEPKQEMDSAVDSALTVTALSICKVEYGEEVDVKTEDVEEDSSVADTIEGGENGGTGEWSVLDGVKLQANGHEEEEEDGGALENDPLEDVNIQNLRNLDESEEEEMEGFMLPSSPDVILAASSSDSGPPAAKYRKLPRDKTASGSQLQGKSISAQNRRKIAISTAADQTYKTLDAAAVTATPMDSLEEIEQSSPVASPPEEPEDNNEWKCDQCNRILPNRERLTRHLRDHVRLAERKVWPARYPCPFCTEAKTTPAPKHWWAHLLAAHQSNLIHCDVCDQHFINEINFEAHNAVLHSAKAADDGPVSCGVCGDTVPDKSLFFDHLLYYHTASRKIRQPKTDTVCETCGRYFPSYCRLREHLKVHLDRSERTIACEFCELTFIRNTTLVQHLAEIHERNPELEKKYKCKNANCDKIFASALTLERHEVSHKKYDRLGKTLRCDLCELGFLPNEQDKLLEHVQTVHATTAKKRVKCDVEGCSYIAASVNLGTLRRHERRDHPYLFTHECTLCDKRYSVRNYLDTHILTHSENGPFVCKVCSGGKFINSEGLAHHLARHNGEDTFKCSHCDMTFYADTALKSHNISQHDAETSHICEECGRRCRTKILLQVHKKRVHPSKDAPKFPCNLCPRVFNTQSQKRTHINQSHSDKDLSVYCEICGFKCRDPQRLRVHNLRYHNRDELEKAKKHVCYFCSKTFFIYFELILHVSVHTLERPYICHVCHKDFTQGHCLTGHLKMHKKDGTFFPKPCQDNGDLKTSPGVVSSSAGTENSTTVTAPPTASRRKKQSLSDKNTSTAGIRKPAENPPAQNKPQDTSTLMPLSGPSTSTSAFYQPYAQFESTQQTQTSHPSYPGAYPSYPFGFGVPLPPGTDSTFPSHPNPRYHYQNPGYNPNNPPPPDGFNFDMLLH